MDIPTAFRWVLLALAVLQLVSLAPVLRRLRRAEPEQRLAARIDAFESLSGMLLLGGLGLDNLTLGVIGLVLMSLALLLRGVRLLASRRRA
ncbi:hypothetical protein [Streptomyces showdoensis]|uniref:hypothetical protein n=1 Tax=Streptomyces showdoensis TaxID=68268 RepID=UPI000F4FDAA7|nr:hypothetical protein [Streptomyces showdoensis]